MKKLPSIIILLIILTACSSVDKENAKAFPYPDAFKLFKKDNNILFSFFDSAFETEREKFELINSIVRIDVNITGQEIPIEFYTEDLKINKYETVDKGTYIYAHTLESIAVNFVDGANLDYKIIVYTENDYYVFSGKTADIFVHEDKAEPLVLSPYVRKAEGGTTIFGVTAYRNYPIEDEYIPNSQTLRVELIGNDGSTIWRSWEGVLSMQVITPVYPEAPGEIHDYEVMFKGKGSNKSGLEPGKYTVRFMIPAVPKPYVTDYILEW